MYKLVLDGYAIECSTLDELRAAVGEFAGQVRRVEKSPTPKPVAASPPTSATNKTSGVARSWQMAEWYGEKKKIDRTIARTMLARLRETDLPQYQQLEAEFLEAGT